MTTENTDTPLMADCPSAPCSGSWIPLDDTDPGSVPHHPGHYLVACEGGNVTESFYVTDLKWYGEKCLPSRKWNGKYSRRFEVAQRGYKITHWMPKPFHPNVQAHGARD